MVEAINQALHEEMQRDSRIVVLGEDVAREGGIFRATVGLQKEMGSNRVFDTPVSESGIVGVSIGLAISGLRPVPELQFSGFSYFAFHQIESHLARLRRRSQGRFTCPIVIRMPYGAGIRALEHHSESREAYYAHTPGLVTVVPRSPRVARGLLKAAIRSEDPVIFLEPAALYRKFREELPKDDAMPTLGQAEVVREGDDVTIVSYGHMLQRSLEAAEQLIQEKIACEVIDLQTIAPLDWTTVLDSVKKTGRLVVLHEGPRSFGVGAEVAARVAETAIDSLEAPVRRITGFDLHPPLAAREQWFLPDVSDIERAVRETVAYT